jgi:hypothetical protein
MVISFRKNIQKELVQIKIGEDKLECVESIKYLGEIIDEKLKFDKTILAIQKSRQENQFYSKAGRLAEQIQQHYFVQIDNFTPL